MQHEKLLESNSIAKERKLEKFTVTDFETVRGKGVCGKINGENYCLGNLSLIREKCLNSVVESAEKHLEKYRFILYYIVKNNSNHNYLGKES